MTAIVFISDEVLLDVGFAAARATLARLARGGLLLGSSEDAYEHGTIGGARVGTAGMSKLVRVQARELSWTDRTAGLALRWEAIGTSGVLFPVLDADIRLTPDGEGTVLTLAGAYRPPLGPVGQALDRALLHKVAEATIRTFLTRVAAQLDGHPVANGAGSPKA